MTVVPSVSAKECQEKLARGDADVYLDVRSTPEFEQGHPAGAYHVPLLEAAPGQPMAPNRDFVAVVKAAFPKDRRIVVGCQSGKRSEQAAAILAQEGYTVWNMSDGFGGARDAFGRKVAASWAEQGLPTETGSGGERGYARLRAGA